MSTQLEARLVFVGGSAAREVLLDLGRAGKEAFDSIKEAADGLAPAFKRFGAAVDGLKRNLSDLGAQGRGVVDSLGTIGDGVKTFAVRTGEVALAAGAAATAILATANAGAEAADQAGKASERLGLTVEQYGELAHAAKMAGIEQETFEQGFNKFTRLVQDAQRGDQKSIDTLERFSVRLKDSSGRMKDFNIKLFDARGRALAVNEVFKQVATNVAAVGKSAGTTDRAIDAFGKSGAKLIPVLLEGRKGLNALGKEAHELGKVFTDEQAKIGDEMGDAMDRTKDAASGLRNQLGLIFAPEITQAANQVTAAIVRNRTEVLDLATRGWNYLLQVTRDFFNAFRGNDAAVANQWVITVRDNLVQLQEAIAGAIDKIILPAFQRLRDVLAVVAGEINKVFGTDITPEQLGIAIAVFKITGLFQILTGAVSLAINTFGLLFKTIQTVISLFPVFAAGVNVAATAMKLMFTSVISLVRLALVPIAAFIGWPATLVIALGVAAAALVHYWDDVKEGAKKAAAFVIDVFKPVVAFLGSIGRVVGGIWDALTGAASPSPTAPAAPGFASGGLFRGKPGVDTNLAWLTDREYVINRDAVSQFGRGFFDAINFGGYIPAFAEGGLVGEVGVGAGAAGGTVNLFLRDGSGVRLNGDRKQIGRLLNSDQFALSQPNRWHRR